MLKTHTYLDQKHGEHKWSVHFLGVGKGPHVRNTNTRPDVPEWGLRRCDKEGERSSQSFSPLPASWARGIISKGLAITSRREYKFLLVLWDHFSPWSHLKFGKWMVLSLETLYPSGITSPRSNYAEGTGGSLLPACFLPPALPPFLPVFLLPLWTS